MAEPQLVDYIKKAKAAGQSDDQSKALLYKNGWTEAEVSEAFAALTAQSQPKPQAQPQPQPKPQPQPQVQPQAQPKIETQPQDNMPRARKSHTILKLLIVLIILIVLGGAGYFVAGQYINLPQLNFSWNPFGPSPETVIEKMLVNMKDVKSSRTSIQGEFKAISNGTSLGTASIIIDTDSDMSDPANPKAKSVFSFISTPAGLSASSIGLTAIAVGQESYVKVDDCAISNSDYCSVIADKWFKIDQDSISSLQQNQLYQSPEAEMVKSIQDIILSEEVFSFDKKLASETVSGQDTHHYLVKISKDKLNSLANKIFQEVLKSQGEQAGVILGQDMSQVFINTVTDAIGDISMEMWIGKKDYMLYKTKINRSFDLAQILPSTGTGVKMELKMEITGSKFNESLASQIQAPQGALKIESVILPILKMQKVMSYMSQIKSVAQSSFTANKSYASLCTRGLLNGYLKDYGNDLIALNSGIISQGAVKPACFSSAQDFCISTQLPDGTFLCVNKDNVGNVKCVSSKTVCQ